MTKVTAPANVGGEEEEKVVKVKSLSQLELAYAIVEAVLTDAERIKVVKTTLKKVIGG